VNERLFPFILHLRAVRQGEAGEADATYFVADPPAATGHAPASGPGFFVFEGFAGVVDQRERDQKIAIKVRGLGSHRLGHFGGLDRVLNTTTVVRVMMSARARC